MSVVSVGGRRFAAGLFWLERGGAASVARNARAFGRPWYVHWGKQTGYAADEERPQGCPSLAAALQVHIGAPFWMALVETDDGRLALVKARDGAFLADGDEVFPDRASALEAFESSRDVGWTLFATPGLVEGEVAGIDPSALADDPAMRLSAAPLAGLKLPNVARILAVAGGVAVLALAWSYRESLWRLVMGPEPVAETEVPVEPPVTAALDPVALLAGCGRALEDHPPYLPAWRTERVSCEGRFGDPALTAARPDLQDRAVLVVRWRLETGRLEPLHRRIAEAHLSAWYAASVTGTRAWAAMPLEPVLRRYDAVPSSLLEFREAVDRNFGTRGSRLEYPSRSADGIEVRIATRRPPARLTEAVAAVPGLELVRLWRDAAGEWRLEGRRVSPVAMPRQRFEKLTQSAAQPATRSAAEPATGSAAGTATTSVARPGTESATRSVTEPAAQPAERSETGRPDHG